jgi:hypothetical protein
LDEDPFSSIIDTSSATSTRYLFDFRSSKLHHCENKCATAGMTVAHKSEGMSVARGKSTEEEHDNHVLSSSTHSSTTETNRSTSSNSSSSSDGKDSSKQSTVFDLNSAQY